ncbi:VRR-NUC domain protein [compost metagenome]
MSTPEHALQNTIRNALAGLCILFRANTGKAWASNDVLRVSRPMTVPVFPGDVVLRKARPFDTGLPPGFSDTFGFVQVTITEDMVGQKFPLAMFGEIKTATGRVSPLQAAFLQAMKNHGARADVWRSVEDALATVQGEESKK